MNFNLNNNQPLIRNQQNYYLDRKLITIHTEDRDTNKWPNENEFEITLPEPVANIQSMRLIEGTFPSNYYTFSEQNQNTKFHMSLTYGNPPTKKDISCTIQDGFYTPEQLAQEIEHDVSRQLVLPVVPPSGVPDFKVFYDIVGQRYYFGVFHNEKPSFQLNFGTKMSYDLSCCNTKEVWEQNTKWGLGYNLGFDKENKDGSKKSKVNFDYLDASHEYFNGFPHGNDISSSYIKAPYTAKLNGEQCFYVEIEKYNEYDELKPYSSLTNSLYNNDYNGNVKAAFAKIPIVSTPNSEFRVSENDLLQNFTQFNPPLERITKLKFKFRYHDGRLVDFKKHEFNFTMELNSLRPEISQTYNVRTPSTL